MGPRKKPVTRNASPTKEDTRSARRSSSRLSLVPTSNSKSPTKRQRRNDTKESKTRKSSSRKTKTDISSSSHSSAMSGNEESDGVTSEDEGRKEERSDDDEASENSEDDSFASENDSDSEADSRRLRKSKSRTNTASRRQRPKAMPIRETRRRSCTMTTTAKLTNKIDDENDEEEILAGGGGDDDDEQNQKPIMKKKKNLSSSSESNNSNFDESGDEFKHNKNNKNDLYDAEENSNFSAIDKGNDRSRDEDDDDSETSSDGDEQDDDDDDEDREEKAGEEPNASKDNLEGETVSSKPMRLTKHGKIDRRTLRGQVGWGKNENGEERQRKKRKRRSRKSLFVNQKYINRQKYILQMAAANGVDISNNPTSKSFLSNTLNNNINNSFSAQLTMLNQQAGCERAPKYVEINYMFKPVILNTFDKGYLIFNYSKEKLEIPPSCDTKATSSANNGSSTTTINSNTLEQINKNQQKILSTLPKVNLEVLKEYPMCFSDFSLPLNLIKFNEKSVEDLDEEVEYDMDDEDNVWLNLVNEERKEKSLKENTVISSITQEQFEMIMDRLEKESYFQQTTSTKPGNESSNEAPSTRVGSNRTTPNNSPSKLNQSNNDSISNDDALCCVCLDGECVNSNAILFCDMCNLPVHQECYGVPYIPEGQWLCRRCICSPSNPVSCELCPNRHGAFKQTDRGAWAHVICAIWIPEVHFANTVFLEPIIGLENIDKARWKLTCYICRKKNAGACIQCTKQNCYTAFHVTCAQQAGLYMNVKEECHREDEELNEPKVDGRKKKGRRSNMEKKNHAESEETEVRRLAFCDLHSPLDLDNKKNLEDLHKAGIDSITDREEALKQLQKIRMKRARKILAERHNLAPTICLPVIPQEKIDEIKSKMDESVEDKNEFFERVVKYWLMKRYSRNGVPLLRRLQNSTSLKKNNTAHKSPHSNPNHSKTDSTTTDVTEFQKLRENLSCFKRLRQELEKARLLMELIRKRERLKLDQIKILQVESYYEINGFNGVFLKRLLNIFCELDKNRFFLNPVDANEAPTYYEEIKEPMDFKKIQSKINALEYKNFSQFENDFNLIIKNCCQFNPKNSIYHKAAVKIKEQSGSILKQARTIYEYSTFPENSD